MGLKKKLLSAILAASLVLGLVGTAAADFTPGGVDAAAKRMQALGIVKGVDASGDLGLNMPLTRAQVVTVLVRAFGQEENAKLLMGAPTYTDVAAGHWASGYIALAKNLIEKQGLTMGVTATTFNPNGELTTAEALAFTMKFLGVKPAAGKSWPMDFMQGAADAGLISADELVSLSAIANTKANRGLAFYLSDKAFASYKLPSGKTMYQTFVDTTPPTLTVDEVTASTDAASVTLTGKVTGQRVLHVGTAANVVTPELDGSWSATLDLKVGANDIWVHALDIVGNAAETTVKITRVPGAAASVEATLGAALLKAGEETDLTVVVKDANGAELADAMPTVTVEGEIGAYADGKFTAATKPATGKLVISIGDVEPVSLDVAVVAGDLAKIAVSGAASAKVGQALSFTAKGEDAHGNEVTVEGATWSATTGGVINPSTGDFAGTASGNVTVTAKVGDLMGTAMVAIYGDASALKIAAPTGLIANGKDTKTITVSVVDAAGNVATNNAASVTLNVSGGKMKLKDSAGADATSVTATAVNGVATFTVYQPVPTAADFVASTTNLSATSGTLTGAVGSLASVAPTVKSVKLKATPSATVYEATNAAVTIGADVVDTMDVVIPAPSTFAVTVSATPDNSAAVTLGSNTLNFTSGVAGATTVTLTINAVPANSVVVAGSTSSGYTVEGFSFATRLAGPAYKLALVSGPSDASAVSGTYTVKVAVQDSLGTTKSTDTTTVVTATATHEDGTTIVTESATVANGVATIEFKNANASELNKAGKWTFTAAATGLKTFSDVVTATASPGAVTQIAAMKVNGSTTFPYTMVANGVQTATVSVELRDAAGNLVPTANNAVTFKVTAANSAVTGVSTTGVTVNAVNGVASVAVTSGITDGASAIIQAEAKKADNTLYTGSNSAGVQATVSTQIVGTPAALAPTTPAGQTAGKDFTVQYQVIDATNPTPRNVSTDQGRAVTLTVLEGTTSVGTQTTTTVNGVAKFTVNVTKATNYTFKATSSFNGTESSTTTGTVAVAPGAATSITITSTVTSVETQTALTSGIKAVAKDAYGNTVADTNSATSTFTGLIYTENASTTLTHLSASTGTATYTASANAETVAIADSDGKATFDIDGAGATAAIADLPVTGVTINTYIAGPAYKLMLAETPASITAGSNATVKVGIYDGAGSLKTSDNTTLVTLAVPAGVTNPSTAAGLTATATRGVATFTLTNATGTGTYQFEATATGLVKATGVSFASGAGTATQVTASPAGITADGSSVAVITFKVADANGNTVTNYSGTMTFTSTGAGGTLLNTSAAINNGTAIVQVKATTQAGVLTITPAISGETTLTFNNVAVTASAGAASSSTTTASTATGTIYLFLRDASGNAITNFTVGNLTQLNAADGDVTGANTFTHLGNGVYTATQSAGAVKVKVNLGTSTFSVTIP